MLIELDVIATVPIHGRISYNLIYDPRSKVSINLSAKELRIGTLLRDPQYHRSPVKGLKALIEKYLDELVPDAKATDFEWSQELHKGMEYDSIATTMAVIASGQDDSATYERLSDKLNKAYLTFRKA